MLSHFQKKKMSKDYESDELIRDTIRCLQPKTKKNETETMALRSPDSRSVDEN